VAQHVPFIGKLFGSDYPFGASILVAGIVLAIMIIPFISSVMREVFQTVPTRLKESAYALGSSTWEVSWDIVLPYTRSAVIGGIFLGLGRALGETMAVAFVLGNAMTFSASLLDPGTSIASTIANQFSEASGLQKSSLMALAFLLFVVTFIVLLIARLMLRRWPSARKVADELALSAPPHHQLAGDGPQCAGHADRPGFLAWILWETLRQGISALNFRAVHQDHRQRREGGLANAMVGSLIINFIGIAIATPIGVLAGTWLAEYANRTKLGEPIRFLNDILLSAPSIVMGLFVYTIIVLPTTALTHGSTTFSGFAGGVALALIALPVIVRTTDEMLRLVPSTLREAALSLGVPQWKLTMQILIRAARSGIITGVLLALARISGETAPLLFTAFGNNYMTLNPIDKMSSLPQIIYQYANDPGDDMHSMAWAGAFVVTMFVLLLSLGSRLVLSRNKVSHD
jgi:phosphate transport system permease protein